jgi:hypothetical protein
MVLRILADVAMRVGGNTYRPRLMKLRRLFSHLTRATGRVSRYTFYGCIFENYGDRHIMAYREYNSISSDIKLTVGEEVVWDRRFRVLLMKDIGGAPVVTHVRDGELNVLIDDARAVDSPNYRALKELKNIEKRVFYTLPIVRIDSTYLPNCRAVRIRPLHI